MDRSQYFVAADHLDSEALISDWRWLVGEGAFVVHQATAMGDLLLRGTDGRIYFLDTTGGALSRIADSPKELEELWEDRHQRRDVLMAYRVREMRDKGMVLAPGECYSWKIPPAFGGELTSANLEPCDLQVHVSILGQLHKQARELHSGSG